MSVTFDDVGAPARLSGGPSAATNIPVVHTLLMAIQSTSDLEPEELQRSDFFSNSNETAKTALLEKWFPLWGERAHSLKLFCM